jgi:apoptosis-inducing factor 3
MPKEKKSTGPDLRKGIALQEIPDDGRLIGQVGNDEVLLIRSGEDVFAISPHCTHYHGPLSEGLIVGNSVSCPWHHACFECGREKQFVRQLSIRSHVGR